jgi:DNA (cytosine-5)-methyltransferase 1
VGAVEIDKDAASTFQVNHHGTKIYIQDIRTVHGGDLMSLSPSGEIDLLTGCPPCQGFTSLTSKYKREDHRNDLILEMSRIIKEVRPRVVMMENVPGLANRGKKLLDIMLSEINDMGYISELGVLQVADYGVPQYRRRLVLLAGLEFHIPLPEPTHSKDGLKRTKWKTVREAIGSFSEPLTLSETKNKYAFPTREWHVVRDIKEISLARLKSISAGASRHDLPEELRPNCHRGMNKGFSNVYGRMEWDQVSPTITGGCTTLSRGRYGHPERNSTISVREAATLQTFPKDYIFDTPFIDHACNIIGNALPCEFAAILAQQCKYYLEKYIAGQNELPISTYPIISAE